MQEALTVTKRLDGTFGTYWTNVDELPLRLAESEELLFEVQGEQNSKDFWNEAYASADKAKLPVGMIQNVMTESLLNSGGDPGGG